MYNDKRLNIFLLIQDQLNNMGFIYAMKYYMYIYTYVCGGCICAAIDIFWRWLGEKKQHENQF